MKRRTFLQFLSALPFVALQEPASSFEVNYDGAGQYTNDFNYKDIYLSPEAMEDIRNWSVDKIDEKTKREIYGGFN